MTTARVTLFLIFLALLFLPAAAFAFKCNVTVTGINFANYDIFSAPPLDSTGTLNLSCNIPSQNPKAPLPVVIAMSTGNSGSFAQRQMQTGGTGTLNYNLYLNNAHSTIWGDGGGSSTALTTLITKATPLTATIYGRIPARQNVRAGSYSDAVVVTIYY